MPTPSRNGPCPCGSGTKYKKCCLPKDEAGQLVAAPPPQPRRNQVIYHRGRPLLVSGNRDLPAGVLDHAVEYYEAKDRGEVPAAQLMRFVEPLLESAGDDQARDRALKLGTEFWNLALSKVEEHEEMLARMLKTIGKDEQDAAEFRVVANNMIERHRAMFPTLHM